jgi:hypothetical protein
MVWLRTLFVLTRFYTRNCFVSLAVSCYFIIGVLQYGLEPLPFWLPLKAMVSTLIVYFLYHYTGKRMYYYYNLHISARLLFSVYVAYDIVFFLLIVCLTNLVRSA